MDHEIAVEKRELEDLLLEVDYAHMNNKYIPSSFALEFITFIKLVNGKKGEENKSAVFHLDMLDQLITKNRDNLFVCFRGGAKTTVLHEYLFLYIAVYGGIPGFGDINVAIYVSDTIDNGVKNMRQNLEYRYKDSEFLQRYLPEKGVKFTDVRWEFTNASGKKFCVRGFGASTGVRGFKEYGQRPTWCGFDDLMSDKNAESPTIVNDIRKVIYKAARQALHPKKRMIVWTGTPFNKKDPLYSAASSKGWNTRVYPICEQFPCSREEFKGGWDDRFGYDFVKSEYDKLLEDGEISSFNQELMLRIVSDEDRMVQDHEIIWYDRNNVVKNKHKFNFYITTDFATSEENAADYSVISVWAYTCNGEWLWVDGVCKRQLMDANVNDLFELVQIYKPQSVGIEVSGQQGGFIPWIRNEMVKRESYFSLATDSNSGKPGIRPNTKKMTRFNVVLPWIKASKIWFPEQMKQTAILREAVDELTLATPAGFKSKHDDFIDTISMLGVLRPWKPAHDTPKMTHDTQGEIWDDDISELDNGLDSYIV